MGKNLTAMVLAAGMGKRMGAISNETPKPLIKIAGKPLIVWHLEKLESAGFQKVVINLFHLGSQIENTIDQRAPKSIEVQFSREKYLLDTAGGIAKALPLIGESPFAVINGDIFTEYNFAKLKTQVLEIGKNSNISGHLVLVANPNHNPKGDFSLEKNLISKKKENALTFSGISIFKRELFANVSTKEPSRLSSLIEKAASQKNITGSFYSGDWFDVGTPQRLETLKQHMKENSK